MKLRISAIVPILCATVALVLSFLLLFAGTDHDMLEPYDVLFLNTSRIGVSYLQHEINSTSSSSSGSSGSSDNPFLSWVHNETSSIEGSIDGEINKIEGDIFSAIDNVTASVAHALGIHDFYSVHILNHCSGYFSPENSTNRNVTGCSDTSTTFDFSPSAAITRELNKTAAAHPELNITLSDLHWPHEIDNAIHDVRIVFDVAIALYCVTIICTALTLLMSVASLFLLSKPILMLVCAILSSCTWIPLVVASALVTYGSRTAADEINKWGRYIDVNAASGEKFIAMSWATVGLLLLASIFCVLDCFREWRHRARTQTSTKGRSKAEMEQW